MADLGLAIRFRLGVNNRPTQTSDNVPIEEVTNQLYDVASTEGWRPGRRVVTKPMPPSLTTAVHVSLIQEALDRARRKTFVRAIKPLRRLLRNQGAVNDSLIEAVYHLFAQNKEITAELSKLQRRVLALELQVQELGAEPVRPGLRAMLESAAPKDGPAKTDNS